MTFDEALKILDIEDYREAIMTSNSHGELSHLLDYIMIATICKKKKLEWFRFMFLESVRMAEERWSRPESIYQHMPRIMHEISKNARRVMSDRDRK